MKKILAMENAQQNASDGDHTGKSRGSGYGGGYGGYASVKKSPRASGGSPRADAFKKKWWRIKTYSFMNSD